LLDRAHVEERDRTLAEDHGAAAVPGLKRERRCGKAAGFAQGAGVDICADADRADKDRAAAFEGSGT